MKIIDVKQGSEEWKKLRLGKISASVAYKAMYPGMRKDYAYQLLAERLTGESPPFEMNHFVQWGIDHEDEARDWYSKATGFTVQEVGFVQASDTLGCSPDGLVGKDGLIEIKCPMSKTHLKNMVYGPKKEYVLQMQFQMYVTQRDWCDFVSYDPRVEDKYKGYITRIERDDETIGILKNCINLVEKEIDKFYETNNNTNK